ncbi:hypothetical protein Cpir12675_005575 [Ceratocystis pirilliformis]|uniref:non-specific serine/threonine protein kinase n=1 Tax=Ceratocystis pirilliformis TaxID=259994 RepID=A0ABR3YPZ8_9PEZI
MDRILRWHGRSLAGVGMQWGNKAVGRACRSRISLSLRVPSTLRAYGYLHDMLLQHPMEEETLPLYENEQYYPVKIGQVFVDRYEVVGKLGYGAHSTSWLCRDLRFRTVKVSTCLGHQPQASAFRERAVYRHIAAVTAQSTHPGKHLIRTLHDDFSLDGARGSHHALVLSPMYATVRERARQHSHGVLRLANAKRLIRGLLLALTFLHDEAGVVHTDLKTDNLMLTIEDGGMLNDFVRQEETSPSLCRESPEGGLIYRSRAFRPPDAGVGTGTPMLCDFGDARIGLVQQPCRHVQPVVFRAPEVVFDMEWGTGADMWNVGGLVWELIQGERLFRDVVDISGGGHNAFRHSARMVALLGNPPESFLHRSMATAQCFDTDGSWIAQNEAEVPPVSLQNLECRYGSASTERNDFLDFIRATLQWLPENRQPARELLRHPWLLTTQ